MKQYWTPNRTKIRKYQRAKTFTGPSELRDATSDVVRVLGLSDACFSSEWRLTKQGWKLIEIQARLGQDEGLPALLADSGDPLGVVERAVCDAYQPVRKASESPMPRPNSSLPRSEMVIGGGIILSLSRVVPDPSVDPE